MEKRLRHSYSSASAKKIFKIAENGKYKTIENLNFSQLVLKNYEMADMHVLKIGKKFYSNSREGKPRWKVIGYKLTFLR